MAAEERVSETRKMARTEPEAVRAVAERVDDPLSSKLHEILAEEQEGGE